MTAVGPSAPRGLKQDISLRYRDALVFVWEQPASNGGSPLQEYTLELSKPNTVYLTNYQVSVQAKSFTFSGLDSATEYAVRIKVNNLVDESDWSDYSFATTGIEPSRPGLLSFDATTRTTINLSWSSLVGADTGGSDTNPL